MSKLLASRVSARLNTGTASTFSATLEIGQPQPMLELRIVGPALHGTGPELHGLV